MEKHFFLTREFQIAVFACASFIFLIQYMIKVSKITILYNSEGQTPRKEDGQEFRVAYLNSSDSSNLIPNDSKIVMQIVERNFKNKIQRFIIHDGKFKIWVHTHKIEVSDISDPIRIQNIDYKPGQNLDISEVKKILSNYETYQSKKLSKDKIGIFLD